jgi:hypothetical protein
MQKYSPIRAEALNEAIQQRLNNRYNTFYQLTSLGIAAPVRNSLVGTIH